MEEENPSNLKSKYNAGVAIQMRLDNLWKDANSHSRSGEYEKWNLDLDTIWSELARDIKEKEYSDKKEKDGTVTKGYLNQFKEFDASLKQSGQFKDHANDNFEKPTEVDIKNRNEQYKILRNKELFLKRLENHTGKGTAFDDEDDDDF